MKDKWQDSYEILGGACIMTFPYLYFAGFHITMMILLLCSVLFYEISAYQKSVLVYLAAAGLSMVLVPLAGESMLQKVLLEIGTGIGAVGYFAGRLKGKPGLFTGISYWYLMLAAAGYLLGLVRSQELWKGKSCLFAGALIIICILSSHQRAMRIYVAETKKLHRFPEKRLIQKSRTAIFVLCTLVLAGMLCGYFFAPEVSVQVKPLEVELTPEYSAWTPETMPQMEVMFGEAEYKEPPVWIQITGEILYRVSLVLIVAGSVVLIGVGIFMLFKKYQKWPGLKEETKDVGEADKIEKAIPRGSSFKKIFEKKTPSELIRKYYKKWIQNALKEIPSAAAPSELENRAALSDEEFHRLYEKARYAQSACTKEESQRIKQKL